jgi:hypothetical protein
MAGAGGNRSIKQHYKGSARDSLPFRMTVLVGAIASKRVFPETDTPTAVLALRRTAIDLS